MVETRPNRVFWKRLCRVFVPRVSFFLDAEDGRPVIEENGARVVLAVEPDRRFERELIVSHGS